MLACLLCSCAHFLPLLFLPFSLSVTALSGTARSPAFTTLALLSSLLMGAVLYKEVFHGFFRLVARSANCCVRMDACHLGMLASVWRMFRMSGALGSTARSLSNLGAFLMCSLAASLHLFLCVARTATLDAFSGFRSNARPFVSMSLPSAAFLASLSARSLPGMPAWPGVQYTLIRILGLISLTFWIPFSISSTMYLAVPRPGASSAFIPA
ncbi:hypothetical protein E4T56_gene9801 [Termitomyces sp. T112]|nr:hypothetical protein E4T56_gene9801 [Termitomyces sp. T112]